VFVFKRFYKYLRGWSFWVQSWQGQEIFLFLRLDPLWEPPSLVLKSGEGAGAWGSAPISICCQG